MFLQVICVSIVAFLVGLVVTFAGYRFFLRLLPFWGFFSGFVIGATAVTAVFGDAFLATATSWIVGFVLGLVFAGLSYFFYIAGVAIFAGSIGYSIGAGLMYLIFDDPVILAFVVGLVGAVVVAAVTVLFNLQKYVIITITAWGGTSAILLAVLLFLGRIELADLGTNPVQAVLADSIIWTVVALVLFVLGWLFQLVSTSQYEISPPARRAW